MIGGAAEHDLEVVVVEIGHRGRTPLPAERRQLVQQRALMIEDHVGGDDLDVAVVIEVGERGRIRVAKILPKVDADVPNRRHRPLERAIVFERQQRAKRIGRDDLDQPVAIDVADRRREARVDRLLDAKVQMPVSPDSTKM
jgi:hypothetical protein